MPSVPASAVGQPAGQLAGVDTDLLGQLKRQVGGVIAVLGVARALDDDRLRQGGGVEPVLGQYRRGGGLEQLGQIGWGHGGPSYGLGWFRPESFTSQVREVTAGGRDQAARRDALGCASPIGAAGSACAPVAQGIERPPPERKAAGSNPAGGTIVENGLWQRIRPRVQHLPAVRFTFHRANSRRIERDTATIDTPIV